METKFTYIQIETKLRDYLEKQKVIPRETWNCVLKRILKFKEDSS